MGENFYRYKLSENAKTDRMKVEGILLTKEWWVTKAEIQSFEPWLKTFKNPTGIVEKDFYDIGTDKSVLISRKKYSAAELTGMKREAIVKIADSWDFKHVGIKKDKLIELIVQKFSEYPENGAAEI
jgi:hypothetical protein